jgi:archaellum component FlaC
MADDRVEQLRQKYGEFYNEGDQRQSSRLREIIERIKDEDSRQNHRLKNLEDAIDVLKADVAGIWKSYTRLETALIGHNGQNGIRGTMMDHYRTTNDRLDKLEHSIGSISQSMQTLAGELQSLVVTLKTIMKIAGGVAGIATFFGVIVGIMHTLGG